MKKATLVLTQATKKHIKVQINGLIAYNIQVNIQDISADISNPKEVLETKQVMLKFYPNDGFMLPYRVNVQGCTALWDSVLGELYLRDPRSTPIITIEARIPPIEKLEVSANGSYDVEEYASAEIYVPTFNLIDSEDQLPSEGNDGDLFILSNVYDDIRPEIDLPSTRLALENGTYDILKYAKLIVKVPTYTTVNSFADLPEDSVQYSFAMIDNTI